MKERCIKNRVPKALLLEGGAQSQHLESLVPHLLTQGPKPTFHGSN